MIIPGWSMSELKQDQFTTPEVAKLLNRTTRKIISYIERGYVSPSIQDSSGHGTKRIWSVDDVIRCGIVTGMECFLRVDSLRALMAGLPSQDLQEINDFAFRFYSGGVNVLWGDDYHWEEAFCSVLKLDIGSLAHDIFFK